MYQSLKARSGNEWNRLHRIYLEEAARHPDAAPHLLFENVVSSMRHWRRQAQPPVPSTLEEYAEAIQGHEDFHELYVGTVRAGGASAVVLGQPGFVALLRAAKTIFADATLKTVPASLPAVQLLTVHVSCEPQFYHPIVALMTSRRRDLCEAIFRHLWELAENPRPEHIVTDYEVALQEALRHVTGRPVVGCYFHYMQALVRQARRLHMRVNPQSPAGRLVRLYGALALLPAERAPAALNALPEAARMHQLPFQDAFLNYFVRHWMARVTPESFSVFGRSHRTTNVAESFHSLLSGSLEPSPNVCSFTRSREHYMCDTEVDLCYSSPYTNNGTCIRREGGYTCVCAPGFTGIFDLEKRTWSIYIGPPNTSEPVAVLPIRFTRLNDVY